MKKILWPTDFSQPSYEALQVAKELAIRFSAELLTVHVIAPLPISASVDEKVIERFSFDALRDVLAKQGGPGMRARPLIVWGDPAREIVRLADSEGVDLVAIATHGRSGWQGHLFGSVAEKVVRLARCSVLTIRPRRTGGKAEGPARDSNQLLKENSMPPLTKILCPTDFSEPSYEAVKMGRDLAQRLSAELYLLHVVSPFTAILASEGAGAPPGVMMFPESFDISRFEKQQMDVARKKLQGLIVKKGLKPLVVRPQVVLGNAAEEIVKFAGAKKIGLIVIATHGRSGWHHLVFGSVAEKVIRLAPCPVLTIRPPRKKT